MFLEELALCTGDVPWELLGEDLDPCSCCRCVAEAGVRIISGDSGIAGKFCVTILNLGPLRPEANAAFLWSEVGTSIGASEYAGAGPSSCAS